MGEKIEKNLKSEYDKTDYLKNNTEKFGDVMMEYVMPMFERVEGDDAEIKIIELAVLCWNLSFLSEDEHSEVIMSWFNANHINEREQDNVEFIFRYFLNRKKTYFSHINIMIADNKIERVGDTIKVNLTIDYTKN
ncbi:hypothetical protein MBAV_005210 [Candidatus Magnetobacterium bavaricum]|uniref:Uncharacterized protein n=1 Tax=Candidatus Magnetobacterium bavaricum TaxID=29290 RepID=A0A0F3GL86_9BACT|nr:hypothetical protein MBAV_005210 [Candidatus Magnetobacterium bavaricum]